VNLGPDTPANAGAYIELFNLRSLKDVRSFHIYASAIPGTGNTVALMNSSGTNANVTIAGSNTASLLAAISLAGISHLIEVSASNLQSGSQVVNFNIVTAP
jgi:hypothetical protein